MGTEQREGNGTEIACVLTTHWRRADSGCSAPLAGQQTPEHQARGGKEGKEGKSVRHSLQSVREKKGGLDKFQRNVSSKATPINP